MFNIIYLLIILLGAILDERLLAQQTTSTIDTAIPKLAFYNPILANLSSLELVFSSKNRCSMYPRCLLFDCCNDSLSESVMHYFEQARHVKHTTRHTFLHSALASCELDNSTLSERLLKVSLHNLTITKEIVADGIAALPPTHPEAYLSLESCCHFRVLYLVQGENRQGLPPAYSSMKDVIFLNYKGVDRKDGELFFPNSTFSYGRMALYLAARQLELSQGWMYDYFVFTDDDARFQSGSIQLYEDFLNNWRPAIGVPAYKKYPKKDIEAVSHVDFIFKGYHREVVEVLLPWVLNFDETCIWTSQLIQMMEATLIYRNHILATKSVFVGNAWHRPYAKYGCNGQAGTFALAIQSLHGITPSTLKHCSIKQMYQDLFRLYTPGTASGIARPKLSAYHLINSFNGGGSIHQDLKSSSCSNLDNYDPNPPNCCSVDETGKLARKAEASAFNNKVITYDNATYFYIFGNERHLIPKSFVTFMGFDESVVFIPDRSAVDAVLPSRLSKLASRCPDRFADHGL